MKIMLAVAYRADYDYIPPAVDRRQVRAAYGAGINSLIDGRGLLFGHNKRRNGRAGNEVNNGRVRGPVRVSP
jgi:hypothetical protein